MELICEEKISKTRKVSQKREKKSLGYYVVISYLFAKVFEFLDNSLLLKFLKWVRLKANEF